MACTPKQLEYQRQWRAKNHDRLLEKDRAWRAENRERLRELQRGYYAANPEYYRETQRRMRRKDPQKFKDRNRRYLTGMQPERYQELMLLQEGACACCGRVTERVLHADHNHATNEPRGLLCARCNTAVAVLENPLFSVWQEYLERYKK